MKVGLLILAAGLALLIGKAMAQPPTPEVLVHASAVVKKQVGRTSSGIPIQAAATAVRVDYSDLSLATNRGQLQLRARVADAARSACARLGTTLALGVNSTADSDCIKTAIGDVQAQIDAAIESAHLR